MKIFLMQLGSSLKFIRKNYIAIFFILVFFSPSKIFAGPLYGPAPSNGVEDGAIPDQNSDLQKAPDASVPSNYGPGFNGALPGSLNQQNKNGQNLSSPAPTPSSGPYPGQSPGTLPNNGLMQASSPAPTFMNNAMPNSSNPFLPSVVSPGTFSGPLENAYLQDGVPQIAAPLMSAVFRPFNLTFFQPDPFQVVPQGSVSLTGSFETDTNIDYNPTQPELGSLYSITPAVMYSTFDDYGFLSAMASGSYFQYDTGNIPSYIDEMGGINAGTYLGTRVFFGAQDLYMNTSTPQMNGQPMAFFNGVNPYWENTGDAEIGIALTPKITFVQSASDMYFDDSAFGAGFMNLQSVSETLNYADPVNYLTATYNYQQGLFSVFPSFYANVANGTAMRTISPTTSLGVGGNIQYFFYTSQPSLNFVMDSYYGIFTHYFGRNIFLTAQGGWNATIFPETGSLYQAPMWDVNMGYTGPRLNLGINAGQFMENMESYGLEMGPAFTTMAIGYLTYKLGTKTSVFSSGSYNYMKFVNAPSFSNNFFQTLLPQVSYDEAFIEQTDGITYKPNSWLTTSLIYNLINFQTNVPSESVIDNQFIAMVTLAWNFK